MKQNNLLSAYKEAIKALPIEKRATMRNGLPLELSIDEISILAFPDYKDPRDKYREHLIKACEEGDLLCYGDIKGWDYPKGSPNPYPKIQGRPNYSCYDEFGNRFGWDEDDDFLHGEHRDCLIHRDDFEAYLIKIGDWPAIGLLANWWSDDIVQGATTDQDITHREDNKLQNISVTVNNKPKGLRNKQVDFIVKTAFTLGYNDLLSIPEGGQSAIKVACMRAECFKGIKHDFSESAFKRAWMEANERGLIRMENKEKYF